MVRIKFRQCLAFYEKMYRIRRFEECLLDLFSQNKLFGTTHTSIGQEAVAVGAMEALRDNDFVFSNHRCHGHFLAYSGRMDILLAEIMGRTDGMCKGLGGSQHIYYKNFYSNGIQGGIVPNATGMALAEKLLGTNNIGVVFLGDGTLGQGIVYESFNLASLWQVPILYIIENNHYAMSTKDTDAVAGNIANRLQSFGIECNETSSDDVEELINLFQSAVDYVRNGKKPFCQIVNTYRLSPHSKGDDYRDPDELVMWRNRDPLIKQRIKCDPNEALIIEEKIEKELECAIDFANKSPINENIELINPMYSQTENISDILNHIKQRCITRLQKSFQVLMEQNNNLLFIGEDLRDPYGGAFKATSGLSTLYSERVFNTPISEAGFTGIGVGLALNKMIPIIEIMFGDFITLCLDQILNHASKYHQMYAKQKSVPLLIRTPMGGGRGYGPTHSQSLEKMLVGIPDINVVALSPIHDPVALLPQIIDNISSPTILIEDKKSYGSDLLVVEDGMCEDFFVDKEEGVLFPIIKLTLDREQKPDIAIITYGASIWISMDAAMDLMIQDEIMADILINTSLSPLHKEYLIENVKDADSIVVVEDGTLSFGWGAEIISSLAEVLPSKKYARVAARDSILPCCIELEKKILPSKNDIIMKVRKLYAQRNINAKIGNK